MERRLFAASNNGARVLIVRAGDFFGPQAGNNWFSQGLVKPGKPVSAVSYPMAPMTYRTVSHPAGDQALRLFNSEIGNATNTMCVNSVPNNCQRSLGLIELNETCRRLIISCAPAAKCCERCAADRGTTT